MSRPAIEGRRARSIERLEALRDEIRSIDELAACPDLCVYATGSYGRLDAGESSDLDLFFVNAGKAPVSRIRLTLIKADLIRLCR